MIKGLYHSGSAMIPRIKKQEVIANNLANVSSPGYKKDLLFTQELSRAQSKRRAQQTDWQRPMIDQVYTTFEQGSLDKTDNPLDLALEGRGFFAFETGDGAIVYSRAGNLTVDSSGFLINPEGHRLRGEGGPIGVAGGPVSISESGQVEVGNTAVANIQVVDFDDPSVLQKTGKTEFMIPEGIEPRAAVEFTIKQGYLESSNVDVIREMIDMIISFRNYEADAQSVKAQDESLEKLINNVGRI